MRASSPSQTVRGPVLLSGSSRRPPFTSLRPILRDVDGVCWLLGFVDESAADGLSGRVRVRGRIVDVDRLEVEYVEAQDGV